jgi:NADP-dependent 3-hydroxy acid dehydrogenase YdfG
MSEQTDSDRRTAVVTGASSGIGRAVAVALGRLGWTVGLGARRADALDETAQLVVDAGGSPIAHPLDVTDAASMDAFLAACGPLDVLVNNAGIATPGLLHETNDDAHRAIIETNLLGPLLLTRRVVAGWCAERRAGDVVFVSSDASVHPRPYLATYGVSKAGVDALAQVLALECEGTGIRSTIVRVGPTLTGFGDGWDTAQFEAIIPRWQRFGIQRHFSTLTPEDVAQAVVTAVTLPPHAWVPIIEVQPRPPAETQP